MSRFTRRAFLGTTALAVTGLAACSTENPLILPTDPLVGRTETARGGTGRVRSATLTAITGQVDLGGPVVDTWTYDGVAPGREIRVTAGDLIEARLVNRLPVETSIHWHGLALRNDMDGVPGLTQARIKPGEEFTYRFVAPTPGTYWFHPHTGTQLDRGLYAPLIVEDPREPGGYDAEWTVVLDDWIDGAGTTPDQVLAALRRGGGHSMHGMGGRTAGGDVTYPHYLLNGRVAGAPMTFTAEPGQRVRIRFVNVGSDTAFRVALGGHRMTVTHTDGFPVIPVDTDVLLIGMGERYDVLITLSDGVFPLVAQAEGKEGAAFALARTGTGAAPPPSIRPDELRRRPVGYPELKAAEPLPARRPDVTHRLALTGGMMDYRWGINGRAGDHSDRSRVRSGQRVRVEFVNTTMMWHPMHVHGHTFQQEGGPRKDTVIVPAGRIVACEFDADNPGQWMIHCHNTYHAEAGMTTVLGYESSS
ncbi:multicopper oxidase family protein [Amycolatopsis sp. NPDC049868]|uniref:multicopper oxidase family protein n=1 Tax=Amycolatopsis sp. NPDC049868 TaxID=3363934 RepID=UPI0037B03259